MGGLVWECDASTFKTSVVNSTSLLQIARGIGYKAADTFVRNGIRERCQILNISLSHLHVKGVPPMEKVLVRHSTYKTEHVKKWVVAWLLMAYKCVHCGLTNMYNGKPFKLELDHVDGRCNNMLLDNIRFLCGNCHSQTKNFAGRNAENTKERCAIRDAILSATDATLRELVANCHSFPSVVAKLMDSDKIDGKYRGLLTGNMKVRCSFGRISYEHFPGKRTANATQTPLCDHLVSDSTYNRGHLKERLLYEGYLEPTCLWCGLGPWWNGRFLALTLDHIDGNNTNAAIGNLRILCYNCHSQTDTFRGKNCKNKKRTRSNPKYYSKRSKRARQNIEEHENAQKEQTQISTAEKKWRNLVDEITIYTSI